MPYKRKPKKVNSFSLFERYFRSMKLAFLYLLFFSFCTANAQLVYLSAEENFSVVSGSNAKTQKAVWLNFANGAASAEIVLASGKKLLRTFKSDIPHSYYIIVNDKVRYRPNMLVLKADTILIGSEKSSIVVISTSAPSAFANELKLLCNLEYEFEKTEKAKWICSNLNPSCDEIVQLLACLEYDASRVEIINNLPKTTRDICRAELQKTVTSPYRATLKTE